ncbi:MAG: serine protease [Alphaproteobacteria bacterium]|nr:MAG: serine protease [Alphaproteobacteria bacterium]
MVLAIAPGSAVAHPADAEQLPRLVKMIRSSLVGIGTFQALRRPPVDLKGSGFVVQGGLHVITNYHVVPSGIDTTANERLVVIVGNGRHYTDRNAEVVAIDAEHDLALLKIDGDPLPPVVLGKGGLLPEGTPIALTGYPIGSILGVYPVTHTGIVAAITPIKIPQPDSRFLDAEMILRSPFDVYQLDATAFPGNSGSPVYDIRTGRVEAILNSTFVKETKERALSEPTGISFAIPVIYVHELLKKAGL